MRALHHTKKKEVAKRMANESNSCHSGTLKGMRTIMTMGEVSGNIEAQKAKGPFVFSADPIAAYMPNIMIKITGIINCEESSCSLTEAPIAAKKEA